MSFGLIRVFIHTLVIAIKKNVCSFTLNTFDWIFPVASIRGKSSLIKQNNGVRCLLVCVYSEICCCASIDTMPYWRPGASKKLYGKLNSNTHMNNDDDAICMNAFSQFFCCRNWQYQYCIIPLQKWMTESFAVIHSIFGSISQLIEIICCKTDIRQWRH